MKSMFQRTSFLLGTALLLTTVGVIVTVLFGHAAGIIILQITLFIILALLVLQRRQTAILQTRLLALMKLAKGNEKPISDAALTRRNLSELHKLTERRLVEQQNGIEKRLINILQAQQISMETLVNRLETSIRQWPEKHDR